MTTSKNVRSKRIQTNSVDKLPDGLQEASNNFNLGRIIDCKEVIGNMNKNYLITTENKSHYIFKIIIKHSLEDLKTESIYLNRLHKYDFPAAYYVEDNRGSPIFQYNNSAIMVQPKLKGTPPLFSTEICSSIGQNIAILHQIPKRGLPKRNHWLKKSFLSNHVSLIQSRLPDKAQRFLEAFDSVTEFKYSKLPKTIVHGDLYTNNCLYQENSLIGFLDWEEVGVAPAILDLATCVFNFCFENDTFHLKQYKAMIDGYQRHRALNELEKKSINLALKYVALNLCAWRLVQFGIYNSNPEIVKKSEIYWNIGLDKLQLPTIQ